MNLDISLMLESVIDFMNAIIAGLPRILFGIIVMMLVFYGARIVRKVVQRSLSQAAMSDAAADAMGRIARWATLIGGVLLAMAIIFPSISPGDLLSTLGIGGVALGFAFRDILQNFFAGIILLLTEPFKVGDQIEVEGFAGTVKKIETRATTLHTYDGRDVIIPNSELFVDSVIVNTAHNQRRSQYDIGIGYGDSIEDAKRIILDAVKGLEGILDDPAVQVLVVDLADFTTNLRVRWWTDPRRSDVITTQDKVLVAVRDALLGAGIDLPFPTQQVLFHDQTEATDGDRARQREGWPAGQNNPEPRKIADVLRARSGNGASN